MRSGLLPKEVLLDVMHRHYAAERWDDAARIAALVAPFMHPRLTCSTVQVKQSAGEMFAAMSDAERLAAAVRELEELAGLDGDGRALAAAKPKGRA